MLNHALEFLLFVVLGLLLLSAAGVASAGALLGGRRGWTVVLTATGAAFLTAMILLMAGHRWDAAVLWQSVGRTLASACEMKAAQWASAGVPAGRIETLRGMCTQYIVLSFPAWILLACLAFGMFTSNLAALLLSRMTRLVTSPAPFRKWLIPEPLIFGFLLACLLKLFRPDGMPDSHLQNITANNLLVFFVGLYAIAGLGIASHFFHKWRFPVLVRVLGYVLLLNLAIEVAALFGILDVWFDFRRIKRSPTQEAVP